MLSTTRQRQDESEVARAKQALLDAAEERDSTSPTSILREHPFVGAGLAAALGALLGGVPFVRHAVTRAGGIWVRRAWGQIVQQFLSR